MAPTNNLNNTISNSMNFFSTTQSTNTSPDKARYEKLKSDLLEIRQTLINAKSRLDLASSYLSSFFIIDGKSVDSKGKLKMIPNELSRYIKDINEVVIGRDIANKLK